MTKPLLEIVATEARPSRSRTAALVARSQLGKREEKRLVIGNEDDGSTSTGTANDRSWDQFQKDAEWAFARSAQAMGLRVARVPSFASASLAPFLSFLTLEDAAESLARFAGDQVEEHGDLARLLLVLYPGPGEGVPVLVWFDSGDSSWRKSVAAIAGAALGDAHRYTAYLWASSAWAADQIIDAPKVRPSTHPSRREIVIIAGRELNGRSLMREHAIHRSGERARLDVEGATHDDVPFEGRFDLPFEWPGASAYVPVVRR